MSAVRDSLHHPCISPQPPVARSRREMLIRYPTSFDGNFTQPRLTQHRHTTVLEVRLEAVEAGGCYRGQRWPRNGFSVRFRSRRSHARFFPPIDEWQFRNSTSRSIFTFQPLNTRPDSSLPLNWNEACSAGCSAPASSSTAASSPSPIPDAFNVKKSGMSTE